jgi:hypothetical protein
VTSIMLRYYLTFTLLALGFVFEIAKVLAHAWR